MPKIKFNLLPRPLEQFLLPCADRIPVTEVENIRMPPNPNSFVCKRITEGCGKIFAVQPRICAVCQEMGKVNQDFVDEKISGGLGVALTHVRRGFYSMDESGIVLKMAYRTYGKSVKGRGNLRWLLEHLVGSGKMTLEFADNLVKNDLPDLEIKAEADEQFLKKAQTGRTREHVFTVTVPGQTGSETGGASSSAGPTGT